MRKKTIPFLLLACLLLFTTACSSRKPVPSGTGPGRMIRRIEVSIQPADERFDRVYATQENMNELLNLLRQMETDDHPDEEPNISGDQTLYTITATFANGEQSIYYLLGSTYLQLGDDPWCIIDPDLALRFSKFINEHPSDDATAPTT